MEASEISLGISPCPNDTFIFYHLLHRKDLPFKLNPVIADVEELNAMVLEGRLDVSKVSYALAARVSHRYLVLESGSALGRGCGPLILGRKRLSRKELENSVIAIPGANTTAALLLRLYMSSAAIEPVPMLFSRIPDAILKGEVDAGVVIHETRFTYRERGLVCTEDLGAWWEKNTGMPLPLGGIIAGRHLPAHIISEIDRGIGESIEFATEHPGDTADFVRIHAQEMSQGIQRRHIDLYVNEFSLALGREGRAAVRKLFGLAAETGFCPQVSGHPEPLFLNEVKGQERQEENGK